MMLDKTVEIARQMAYFTVFGDTTKLFLYDDNKYPIGNDSQTRKVCGKDYAITWLDSVYSLTDSFYIQRHKNIVYITSSLSVERKINNELGSGVKIYSDDLPEDIEKE